MGLRIIYRLLRVVIQRAEVCSALDTQADLCLGVTRKHALILIRGWVSPFIAPLFIRHTHLQRVVDKEKFEGHLYFCSVIHQPRSGSNVHRLLWLSNCSPMGCWPCQRQQHVDSSKPSLTHKWQGHEHTDSFWLSWLGSSLTWAFCLLSPTLVSYSTFQEKRHFFSWEAQRSAHLGTDSPLLSMPW